jgi:eukaryotic-like serine/threonine-protein kinase
MVFLINRFAQILIILWIIIFTFGGISYGEDGKCGTGQVLLPSGRFDMGSKRCSSSQEHLLDGNANKTVFRDECPVHQVTLSAFCLSQYETTVSEFWKWAKAEAISFYFSNTAEVENQDNPFNPIREISWYLADRYCRSKGGRLPTEAEWEYAASVDTGKEHLKYTWPSGEKFPLTDEDLFEEEDEIAFIKNSSKARQNQNLPSEEKILYSRIQPVTTSYQGTNGLFGMMGNVWEWTADWYGPYSAQPVVNPKGQEEGLWKIIRGGSYQNVFYPEMMRATLRNRARPDAEYYHIGFRCAWPVKE